MIEITNKYNLPQKIVDIIKNDRRKKIPHRYSATEIINSTAEIILKRRYPNYYTPDVSEYVNMLFGTAFHSLFEDDSEYSEQKHEIKIGDATLVGKIDRFENNIIDDYKTTSAYKVKLRDFSDWEEQGLIYAWILFKKGLIANKIRFIAFIKDWSKGQADRDINYPQSQIYVHEFEVKINDIMNTEKRVKEKIADIEAHLDTPDNLLPYPSDDELWYTGTKYAVWRNNGRKAVKIFDTKNEALDFINDGKGDYIETRYGEYNKLKYDNELRILFEKAGLRTLHSEVIDKI